MISRAQAIGFWLAALGAVAALALPVSTEAAPQIASRPGLLVATVATAVLFALAPRWPNFAAAFGIVGAALGCAVTLILLADKDIAGYAGWGFWLLTLATWLGAALGVTVLTALRPIDKTVRRLQDLAIPLLFGAFLIYLWEVVVRGFGVSPVLMPSPSSTAQRIFHSLPTLGEDFVQTFVRSVLSGYAIGCGLGFAVAVVAYRFDFLERGLLPLGNFVSALPIVGIAPIMVMWFGFDWPSKAAVVAVMCFFPMLVNTLAGLAAAGSIERDLMRSYGAPPRQTLLKLQSAGGHALHLQRAEDQFDARFDRRDRRRVLRHAAARHRLSHFHRGGAHVARHGVGGNRAGRGFRNGVLRGRRAGRARDDVLAPVVPVLKTRQFEILWREER